MHEQFTMAGYVIKPVHALVLDLILLRQYDHTFSASRTVSDQWFGNCRYSSFLAFCFRQVLANLPICSDILPNDWFSLQSHEFTSQFSPLRSLKHNRAVWNLCWLLFDNSRGDRDWDAELRKLLSMTWQYIKVIGLAARTKPEKRSGIKVRTRSWQVGYQ